MRMRAVIDPLANSKMAILLVNIIRYHFSFVRRFDDMTALRSDENDED
jgi:hypothetical protein